MWCMIHVCQSVQWESHLKDSNQIQLRVNTAIRTYIISIIFLYVLKIFTRPFPVNFHLCSDQIKTFFKGSVHKADDTNQLDLIAYLMRWLGSVCYLMCTRSGGWSKICLAQLSPSGEKNHDGHLPRQRAGAAPSHPRGTTATIRDSWRARQSPWEQWNFKWDAILWICLFIYFLGKTDFT